MARKQTVEMSKEQQREELKMAFVEYIKNGGRVTRVESKYAEPSASKVRPTDIQMGGNPLNHVYEM